MAFFSTNDPLLRFKQTALDIQDLCGLIRFNGQIAGIKLFSKIYTRIDQAFLLWGLIVAIIFISAQFLPISWDIQAIIWTILTLIGTIGMTILAHFWVKVERLYWLIYWWSSLMLIGLILTDLGIFGMYGVILKNLCPLWLALSAVGYMGTGLGLRSRAFLLAGILHLLGILLLVFVGSWQFLATGGVMTFNLLLLAELQWDMRHSLEVARITEAEREFNRRQHQLRQAPIWI